MKRSRFLASVAAVIFAIGGLAIAQEGYYGQQATTNQSTQQKDSSPRQVACACGHMHGTAAKGSGASQADPNAPQNLVEYGG